MVNKISQDVQDKNKYKTLLAKCVGVLMLHFIVKYILGYGRTIFKMNGLVVLNPFLRVQYGYAVLH
ncbi:hypothetical protein [Lactiplantibacillus plantarum]|uniref:hypothetical protein n=1 Tax=Lactiplantibacillus plantarum TaxID=1590 RepID=UPI00280BFC79|nr:hypothetical protein [Lactiplantibacillus plantarum]